MSEAQILPDGRIILGTLSEESKAKIDAHLAAILARFASGEYKAEPEGTLFGLPIVCANETE